MRKLNGTKIAELRKQKGWDQYELAAAADVAPSVVSRLERNLQADFKLSVVEAVAEALGVSINGLLIPESDLEVGGFDPDLEAALAQLRLRPPRIQRQVAGIIRGFLTVVDEEQ